VRDPSDVRPVRLTIALVALLAVAVPALAAPPKRLPEGSRIAAVPVGGLGPVGAERELRRVLGERYERPMSIRVDGRTRTYSPSALGQAIDYGGMVAAAFAAAEQGERVNVSLARTLATGPMDSVVGSLERAYRLSPRNARARFGVTRVVRIRHRVGRRLDRSPIRRALLGELRSPSQERLVSARTAAVRPSVTTSRLGRIHHTFVSIDRRSFTLRLFKRLRVVRTYKVAVGAGGYETPAGARFVQYKDSNPAWHAPDRPWAGEYRGQTIPPGDPRNPIKARFIALGDGYGIHGTAEEWSIGTRASHGCIRMRVREVKLLYPHVPVGTRVLIR